MCLLLFFHLRNASIVLTSSPAIRTDISNNQLQRLPNQIGNVKGLLVLKAGFNKLRELPDEFSGLCNLQELSLRDNPTLEALPSIALFRSLSKLSLRNSKLDSVPTEVCDLPNLSELDLRDNVQMRAIPVEIGRMRLLRKLDLYGLKLAALPREIGQLAALQHLDLRHNNLTANTLPLEIFNLAELKKLYLANNQLAVLPDEVFFVSFCLFLP